MYIHIHTQISVYIQCIYTKFSNIIELSRNSQFIVNRAPELLLPSFIRHCEQESSTGLVKLGSRLLVFIANLLLVGELPGDDDERVDGRWAESMSLRREQVAALAEEAFGAASVAGVA